MQKPGDGEGERLHAAEQGMFILQPEQRVYTTPDRGTMRSKQVHCEVGKTVSVGGNGQTKPVK